MHEFIAWPDFPSLPATAGMEPLAGRQACIIAQVGAGGRWYDYAKTSPAVPTLTRNLELTLVMSILQPMMSQFASVSTIIPI